MPEPETAKAKATPEQISEIKRIKASKDLYKILNIEKDATDDEIKKAYRKLALKLHPDKSSAPGTEEAFKSLSTAFATLSDKEKRSNYDAFGNENVNRHNHQFNQFNGQDIDPQELFNMFFNGI